ncbi:MAG: hypothetical protein RSC71_04535 [Cetobacterium sp.]
MAIAPSYFLTCSLAFSKCLFASSVALEATFNGPERLSLKVSIVFITLFPIFLHLLKHLKILPFFYSHKVLSLHSFFPYSV